MSERGLPAEDEFDLRARAELSLAFKVTGAPVSLQREPVALWSRRGFQRACFGCLLTGAGAGTVMAMRPPPLVRGAIEHEFYERTLRGTFMNAGQLMEHMGRNRTELLPGFPQLMRPCDIDGHLVYHLTTFFEKGGMVTVFAFDQPVQINNDEGWWNNVYWKVIRSRADKPLVLIGQKEKALMVAQARLQLQPSASP